MSAKITNINIQNSYSKNNKIRTKLLLFIDNEIQSKIKENGQKLKFTVEYETEFKISFEETFTQTHTNKYDFYSLNTQKKQKDDNIGKSYSTIDYSSKKISGKLYQNERGIIHSKTLNKEDNLQKKILNNTICFNNKIYTIKNVSRQSSTFLILKKQKNAAAYLKNLCNNLKITKSNKSHTRYSKHTNINTKFSDSKQNKTSSKKSNEIKIQKSKINKKYTNSSFSKLQNVNAVNN